MIIGLEEEYMTNLRWSLDELYKGFDSEEFKSDKIKFEEAINEMKTWANKNLNDGENGGKKIEEFINMKNDFNHLVSRLDGYASLTCSVEAKNQRALSEEEIISQKCTEVTEVDVKFEKWFSSLENIEEIINSSAVLKEHKFFLEEIKEESKYSLSEKEEIVVAKLKNTGSNAWNKLQNMMTANLLVDINLNGEDKKLPLPVVRNLAYDKDAYVRKAAYFAELNAYKKIEETSAACLNGIKGEVISLSKLRGYSSPLEQTILNSRMDMESLNAMLAAIKESLPDFQRYYSKKAELLGHKNGLPFYDMFAPMGEVNIEFTYEEAMDFVVKNFRTFSDKLADFAKNAYEKRWIDSEPREGKRGGAFCSNLHVIKESRVMSNFTGSFSDMCTLAHELGHGYHGSCLMEESYLNSRYPMPIAETASIFCETIVKNAALKNASREEAFVILENDISDSGQVIVDIYSRFLFESSLFEGREKSSLSVNELKELMLAAQKGAYGKAFDENYLHPYMWANKPHYYYAERNFYNFPYAFGLLFAKGLYAEYLKRGNEFVAAYDKLLAATGKNKVADITKMMGIDIHDIRFWRSSLDLVREDINKFISLSK